MSEEWNKGWAAGVDWAKANWYDSPIGKNVDGGILGQVLSELPEGISDAGFAEGVRYALGNPTKV